jgi:hypothetical protein
MIGPAMKPTLFALVVCALAGTACGDGGNSTPNFIQPTPTPSGTPIGSSCTLLSGGSTVTPAGTTPQLSGTISAGSYCLVVSDVGNQTAAITYAATVTHF